ncbi:MAG TPA: hypothetical protein DCL38_07250 [Lachnospiraceae bacterium]|nr:hypothetical protein [Lachnospiraceae bacterium]
MLQGLGINTMPIVAGCIAIDKGAIWEYFPKCDVLCPHCTMIMKLRDHALRILKRSGGEKDYVRIPRFQCNNESCPVKVIRVLPEELTPYKHYTTPTIEDALDDKLDEEETRTEDGTFSPSAKAVSCWHKWISKNETFINGFLKSVGFRYLGYGVELLKSTLHILEKLRAAGPGWLSIIQRIIYSSGSRLTP